MNCMTENVKIEVRPVALAGEKVLKYQASASLKVSAKRTVRILGDPAFTQESAVGKLESEFVNWKNLVSQTARAITIFKERHDELFHNK